MISDFDEFFADYDDDIGYLRRRIRAHIDCGVSARTLVRFWLWRSEMWCATWLILPSCSQDIESWWDRWMNAGMPDEI